MSTSVPSANYIIPARDFVPAYLALYRSGELQRRAAAATAELAACYVCPRDCGVNRLIDKTAACKTGRLAQVASYFPHFGEEGCLRGWQGSGTIFFSMCNLRCVFCQNYDSSQANKGREVSPLELAAMMMELQEAGCHNINFVTPEHVVPQLLEGLVIAAQAGLHVPLVYNTSAYDSLESLSRLDGVIDIYMPDFKLWTSALSLRYLKAKDYAAAAGRASKEMYRQVGPLKFDERGLAKRGLLLRHLVMPGLPEETRKILAFLAAEIGPELYINLMAQYYPAGKVGPDKYSEINRGLSSAEYHAALQIATEAGFRLDTPRPFD